MPRIKLCFGALMPPIKEQLHGQGYRFRDVIDVERLSRARESLTYLGLHGFVSRSEEQKARGRIMKAIVAAIEPIEMEDGHASE